MKTAVVYYSLHGDCAFAAEQIKALLNADLIRLETRDEKKRSFLGKMLWGGSMASLHIKPGLKPYTFDPSAYELIVIGTPVWAWSPAPPIQTFLGEANLSGKKIALFICHGSGPKKAMKKFKALLAGNEIIAETDFENAIQNSEKVKQKITDWVKGFAAIS